MYEARFSYSLIDIPYRYVEYPSIVVYEYNPKSTPIDDTSWNIPTQAFKHYIIVYKADNLYILPSQRP